MAKIKWTKDDINRMQQDALMQSTAFAEAAMSDARGVNKIDTPEFHLMPSGEIMRDETMLEMPAEGEGD